MDRLGIAFRPKGPAIRIAQPIGLGPMPRKDVKAQRVGHSAFVDVGEEMEIDCDN